MRNGRECGPVYIGGIPNRRTTGGEMHSIRNEAIIKDQEQMK
jgi:hypothetical protein